MDRTAVAGADPDVVVEDVETPEVIERRRDHRGAILVLRDVRGHHDGLATRLADLALRLGG